MKKSNKNILLTISGIALGYFIYKKYLNNKTKIENSKREADILKYASKIQLESKPDSAVQPKDSLKINNVIQKPLDTPFGSMYNNVIIPKGSIIEDMTIKGFGGTFKVKPLNKFDTGFVTANFNQFDIIQITDTTKREIINKQEFPNAKDPIFQNNGFNVMIGDIVKAKLNEDIQRSYPNQEIIMT